jgi:phage-related protein
MTAPVSHLQEAQKLTADSQVDLYKVQLVNQPVIFRFKDGESLTWLGDYYEGMACSMSGDTRSGDGEESKPILRVMNPLGIFNYSAINGDLEKAVVTRRRVLRQHVDSNANIYEQRMWYVGRVRELISGQSITFELKNMTEGPNFQIPVRMYLPPEFPFVTL